MNKEDIGILIVDDEPAVRNSLKSWFEKEGYRTGKAGDAGEAMEKLSADSWEIVLLDIKLPGVSGIELQKRIKEIDPEIIIIMITAYASIETAVESLKAGAFDYVTKPTDPDELSAVVRRATEQLKLKTEENQAQRTADELVMKHYLIGESPQIKKVLELVNVVSKTDVTVLIRGDQGTGKELVARMIHANSSRKFFPLIPVSCGSFGETLLEYELFGHERDALIGAPYLRKGKLEMAAGGTLFLDEVGAISGRLQKKLLGVLKDHKYTGPNGSQAMSANFRIICATNQDLDILVKEGLFNEELFYFVNVFQIDIPSLSERRTDIPLLVDFYVDKYSSLHGKNITQISKMALNALKEYAWPGNVRELENAVERAVVASTGLKMELKDLPTQITSLGARTNEDSLEIAEKKHIVDILEKSSWNVSRAAKRLGVDRATLYNKIKKYKLSRQQ